MNHTITLTKAEKYLLLTADDTAFLESCGVSWGHGAYTAEQMRMEKICVLAGTIEAWIETD
jgi:hypothetical protein